MFACEVDATQKADEPAVVVAGEDCGGGAAVAAPGAGQGGAGDGSARRFAYHAVVGPDPESGEPCISMELREIGPDDVAATFAARDALEWARFLREAQGVEDPWCDDASRAAVLAELEDLVDGFVRSVPLPDPSVVVAPGWALTGMPAYLEVVGQQQFSVREDIVGWGQLALELRPVAVEIDWGDGTVQTLQGRLGAPWDGDPAQQIGHVYLDAAEQTVVEVDVRWDAAWSLGTVAGTVPGLTTSTTLPLPVREQRPVRVATLR